MERDEGGIGGNSRLHGVSSFSIMSRHFNKVFWILDIFFLKEVR